MTSERTEQTLMAACSEDGSDHNTIRKQYLKLLLDYCMLVETAHKVIILYVFF